MKKIYLFIPVLLFAITCQAQVVLWNGDDKEIGSDGGFWDRAEPTVIDDNGNQCLKIKLKENPGGWTDEHRMAALPLTDKSLKGLRRISMRIKMAESHNVMIKLVKDGSYSDDDVRRWFWYGTPNEWQKVTFEYGVGPKSDVITDDNSLLEIYPYEFEDKWGQVIYIDDIVVEGPVVNDVAVRTLAEGSLNDRQVIVSGSLAKGSYQNTWDGDWHTENFDDYSLLLNKLSADVCFLNLTGAAVTDGDGPQLRTKNPNLLILSPTDFYDSDNVIRWDEANSRNNAKKLLLSENYPFYTPIDFHADNVEVATTIAAGRNEMCLPFYVGKSEIGGTNGHLYIYKEMSTSAVTFSESDHADANIAFLLTDIENSTSSLSFTDKGIVNTDSKEGADASSDYVGVYAPADAAEKWTIGSDNKFYPGTTGSTIRSFKAYLKASGSTPLPVIYASATGIDELETADGVNTNAAQPVYTIDGRRITLGQMQKGIYLINHKKVAVK